MNFKNKNDNKDKKPKISPLWYYIGLALVFTLIVNTVLNDMAASNLIPVHYNEFINMLEKGEIEAVEITSGRINIKPKSKSSAENDSAKLYYTGNVNDPQLTDRLLQAKVEFETPVINQQSPIISFILTWIIPIGIFYLITTLLGRSVTKRMGGGVMSFGQNTAKIYAQKQTGVTFSDVAGQEEAKESLTEIIDFLHNPTRYTDIGAKLPKGALLVGPPGTGKTLLAKAVAGEANVPFFSLSGSDFVEMFVGVGASRVRDLFKQAVTNAPCIIFIDEVDAIGKSRDTAMGGGNDEREQTLNQLLAEMDGFDSSKGVVILAATNRPEVLDKALLRPGRFDRRVIVDKPDLKGREAILKVHTKAVKLETTCDLGLIALQTSGAVGADLANIVNEAALRAVRLKRDTVSQGDLLEAIELIVAGKEKKDRILTEKEKRIVSFHEVGHALASALQKDSQPVQKITIVPRTMGALGYTMQMPEEEKYLMSRDEIISQIVSLLAGRAAEEVEFDIQTTGASNDIERATKLARNMVSQFGMSQKFGMTSLESVQSQYLDGRPVPTCAEATSAELDSEVIAIIAECHGKAVQILKENIHHLRKISEFLIEKETVSGEEFMRLLKG